MTGRDKRDECGCHKECVIQPHFCKNPCIWPACLTEAEKKEVANEVDEFIEEG